MCPEPATKTSDKQELHMKHFKLKTSPFSFFKNLIAMYVHGVIFLQDDPECFGLGLVDLIWGVPPAGRPLLWLLTAKPG